MQKETLLQYLQRKIKGQKGDYKNKILFSQRILNPYLKIKYRFSRDYRSPIQRQLDLIENALIDPNGLGRINLALHNAHIPRNYYDIFYSLLRTNSMGGGKDLYRWRSACGANHGFATILGWFCASI